MTFDSYCVDTMTGCADMENQEAPVAKTERIPMKENVTLPDRDTFVIDKNHLDREWEKQSVLTFQLTEENASAQFSYDAAKRRYEVVRAEVNLDVRKNPAKYGFASKPTEAAIDALVDSNRQVCEAAAAVQQARYDLDMTKAGVAAIESKKKALEALTQLTAINYYTSR